MIWLSDVASVPGQPGNILARLQALDPTPPGAPSADCCINLDLEAEQQPCEPWPPAVPHGEESPRLCSCLVTLPEQR